MQELLRCRVLVAFSVLVAVSASAQGARRSAQEVLASSGFRGGLIVHLGCGEGELTLALARAGNCVVQGLTRDPGEVTAGRRRLRARGMQGRATVQRLASGVLPYADSLVNLLVVSDAQGVDADELTRVLAPGGGLMRRGEGGWDLQVQARPASQAEWTHFLYDASNNAVSPDAEVDAPRRLRWVGAPMWARSHEHQGTVSALVSAGGRVVYIADHGPTASIALPPDWRLVARDAYSGVVLWERPMGEWVSHLRPFRSGPAHLPRRLVCVGDRIYVTLGIGQPVSCLDAASGETLRTYAGTEGCSEIVTAEDALYLVLGEVEVTDNPTEYGPFSWRPPLRRKRLVVVDADSGSVRWRGNEPDTRTLMPLTLTVAEGTVLFHNTTALICLDSESGAERWRAARPVSLARPAWSSPTVVYRNGVVLCADRTLSSTPVRDGAAVVEWVVSHRGGGAKATVTAYDAVDGAELWAAPCSEGYTFPPDVFVANDRVWTGFVIKSRDPGFLQARDLRTGKVAFERPADQEFFQIRMGHHRCYRNRATERFLVLGRAGVEFVDLATGEGRANHWVRGTCQYGVMPANGLLYVPPHSCACHLDAKLSGFNALDAGMPSEPLAAGAPERLVRGPAFGDVNHDDSQALAGDWPTFRHDAARSGATPVAVDGVAELGQLWEARLGGPAVRLTAPVAAAGLVLLGDREGHSLHALSLDDGASRWTFDAGSRIDSPPTVFRGRVLVGSADGHVTCLRATDGRLCWQFLAAPERRQVMSYGQLESAWPVHGSVLVQDGVAYVVAGRSGFLDGGIHVYGLDAVSGRVLAHRILDSRDSETGEEPANVTGDEESPRTLPDVLSSDGTNLFMRQLRLDRESLSVLPPDVPHLWSVSGWLDDSWWHRSYWLYGTTYRSGWGGWWQSGNRMPSGRLLTVGSDAICGFGRAFMPQGNAGQWYKGERYRFFGVQRDVALTPAPLPGKGKKARPDRSLVRTSWSGAAGMDARAMVLAGKTLFAAGAAGDTRLSTTDYLGGQGTLLKALAPDDGTVKGTWSLPAMPVFDGMIAAHGRLLVSLVDGRLVCLGRGGDRLPAQASQALESVATAPERGDASARARPKLPEARVHPDFQHVVACRIGARGDGYRIVSDPKLEGVVLGALPEPVRGRVRMQAEIRDVQGLPGRYGNAFIAFGDGTDSASMVTCGMRIRIQRLELNQGGLTSKRLFQKEVGINPERAVAISVVVDLPAGTVTATVGGESASAKLPQPLSRITHIGYALINAAADVSPIVVTAEEK